MKGLNNLLTKLIGTELTEVINSNLNLALINVRTNSEKFTCARDRSRDPDLNAILTSKGLQLSLITFETVPERPKRCYERLQEQQDQS